MRDSHVEAEDDRLEEEDDRLEERHLDHRAGGHLAGIDVGLRLELLVPGLPAQTLGSLMEDLKNR